MSDYSKKLKTTNKSDVASESVLTFQPEWKRKGSSLEVDTVSSAEFAAMQARGNALKSAGIDFDTRFFDGLNGDTILKRRCIELLRILTDEMSITIRSAYLNEITSMRVVLVELCYYFFEADNGFLEEGFRNRFGERLSSVLDEIRTAFFKSRKSAKLEEKEEVELVKFTDFENKTITEESGEGAIVEQIKNDGVLSSDDDLSISDSEVEAFGLSAYDKAANFIEETFGLKSSGDVLPYSSVSSDKRCASCREEASVMRLDIDGRHRCLSCLFFPETPEVEDLSSFNFGDALRQLGDEFRYFDLGSALKESKFYRDISAWAEKCNCRDIESAVKLTIMSKLASSTGSEMMEFCSRYTSEFTSYLLNNQTQIVIGTLALTATGVAIGCAAWWYTNRDFDFEAANRTDIAEKIINYMCMFGGIAATGVAVLGQDWSRALKPVQNLSFLGAVFARVRNSDKVDAIAARLNLDDLENQKVIAEQKIHQVKSMILMVFSQIKVREYRIGDLNRIMDSGFSSLDSQIFGKPNLYIKVATSDGKVLELQNTDFDPEMVKNWIMEQIFKIRDYEAVVTSCMVGDLIMASDPTNMAHAAMDILKKLSKLVCVGMLVGAIGFATFFGIGHLMNKSLMKMVINRYDELNEFVFGSKKLEAEIPLELEAPKIPEVGVNPLPKGIQKIEAITQPFKETCKKIEIRVLEDGNEIYYMFRCPITGKFQKLKHVGMFESSKGDLEIHFSERSIKKNGPISFMLLERCRNLEGWRRLMMDRINKDFEGFVRSMKSDKNSNTTHGWVKYIDDETQQEFDVYSGVLDDRVRRLQENTVLTKSEREKMIELSYKAHAFQEKVNERTDFNDSEWYELQREYEELRGDCEQVYNGAWSANDHNYMSKDKYSKWKIAYDNAAKKRLMPEVDTALSHPNRQRGEVQVSYDTFKTFDVKLGKLRKQFDLKIRDFKSDAVKKNSETYVRDQAILLMHEYEKRINSYLEKLDVDLTGELLPSKVQSSIDLHFPFSDWGSEIHEYAWRKLLDDLKKEGPVVVSNGRNHKRNGRRKALKREAAKVAPPLQPNPPTANSKPKPPKTWSSVVGVVKPAPVELPIVVQPVVSKPIVNGIGTSRRGRKGLAKGRAVNEAMPSVDFSKIAPCDKCFHRHVVNRPCITVENCWYRKEKKTCGFCKAKEGGHFADAQSFAKRLANYKEKQQNSLHEGPAVYEHVDIKAHKLDRCHFRLFTGEGDPCSNIGFFDDTDGRKIVIINAHATQVAKSISDASGKKYPIPDVKWLPGRYGHSDEVYCLFDDFKSKATKSMNAFLSNIFFVKIGAAPKDGAFSFITFNPAKNYEHHAINGVCDMVGSEICHKVSTMATSCGSLCYDPRTKTVFGFHYRAGRAGMNNVAFPLSKNL